MEAFEVLQAARDPKRPSGKWFIKNLCTDFIELRGDRRYGDDHAVIGGIGRLGGMAVTVIAHEKGADLTDRARRNFGSAHPEGYRKALRLMRQAEKFGRPVLCLVDTSGAYSGIGAEERGQGHAIAENLGAMMTLRVPILSVVVGEGGSGGALAMAVADQVWMLENSVYSVISPEGCASILWKNATRTKEASECLHITPEKLYELKVIDRIIEEVPTERLAPTLRDALVETFIRLKTMDADELCELRYRRFRQYGVYAE